MAKFDKSMEYISQTQTLIGQQRKRLVDQDTGEVIEVDQITKRALGQKQFWKIYLIPTGSQKTSEIRYRENFCIKSLKNLDFTRV